MKKTLAALAVLGAFAGTAPAADVNLYGVVDTGLAYTYKNTELAASDADLTNGGESQFGMQSGYNSGSRFGLKGTEDLGNGLRIGFKLENGFSSDDGNFKYENRLFGREASLSLMSEFGTFSFGRMGGVASAAGTYDVVYAIADSFDGGDNDVFGMHSSSRYDNMVAYQSPKFAGVQATAQYSFKQNSVSGSGNEGTSKVDRYASLALTGDFGPLQTVAAYELTKYANTDKHDDTNAFYLGGNYDLQFMKLFALAQYTKGAKSFAGFDNPFAEDVEADVPGAKKGIDSYGLHIGTIVPVMGGDLTVGAYYLDGDTETLVFGGGDPDEKFDFTYAGLSARYVYPLSKRTSVYAGAGYGEEKAESSAAGIADSKNKIGQAYAGITHTF